MISGAKVLFNVGLLILPVTAGAELGSFPDWLGGSPDTAVRSERCSVYRLFLEQADEQTNGLASQQDLARSKVINIVNKLVDHHQADREPSYEARVKYLVFSETGPFHFAFRITAAELGQLLEKPSSLINCCPGRGEACFRQ